MNGYSVNEKVYQIKGGNTTGRECVPILLNSFRDDDNIRHTRYRSCFCLHTYCPFLKLSPEKSDKPKSFRPDADEDPLGLGTS